MSKPVTHPGLEELRAYSLGRLGDSESRHIERHVMSCSVCKEHLFELPATDNFIEWLQKVHRERRDAEPPAP